MKTRNIRLREMACFNVSTSPMRTVTEKVSSSRIMTSAAVAPVFLARSMACCAVFWRSAMFSFCGFIDALFFGAAYGDLPNLDRRKPDADWNGLAVLSTNTDTMIQFEIISHRCHLTQHGRTVTDQGRTLHRRRDFSIFNQVGFICRKNK